jgi:hypothetical protein
MNSKRDLLGILLAILGAITVVLASRTSDVRLDPTGLQRAISQRPFIIFSCIYVIAAIVLAGLSEGEIGKRVVFVDVGLCAIFGTVLPPFLFLTDYVHGCSFSFLQADLRS